MSIVLLLTMSVGALLGQQQNYTPGDIEEGGRLYRINCIGCHGPEGNLVSGIDLGRNRFRRVSSDDDIVDVIMNGVPGTGMPPNAIVRLRAYNVVAYLRSMNTSGVKSVAAGTGDAGRGRVLFEGKGACNSCHRVFGEGSRNGPDLSEAGLMLRAIEIETSILDPNAAIPITSDLHDIDGLFSSSNEITIYRIIQESLNNVVKHSHAAAAHVTVRSHEHEVELVIRDNGQGFSPGESRNQAAGPGGFGLKGIAERVQMLGGTHTIESAPGHGTAISVRIETRRRTET